MTKIYKQFSVLCINYLISDICGREWRGIFLPAVFATVTDKRIHVIGTSLRHTMYHVMENAPVCPAAEKYRRYKIPSFQELKSIRQTGFLPFKEEYLCGLKQGGQRL